MSGVTSRPSLEAKARQVLEQKVYTGYEGNFQAWLLPYVDAGYKVVISDPDYEYKDGAYYVTGVETTFSRNGGVRKVTLGKRIGR